MDEFIYALTWVFDAAPLGLRGKTFASLVGNPIGVGDALARLFVFAIGAGLLARIVQSWMFYRRYTRTGRAPASAMLG